MGKPFLRAPTLLLLLLSLGGCGSSSTPRAADRPAAASPLLVLTDSRANPQGTITPQVEAYQQGTRRWAVALPAPGEALAEASGVVYVGAGATVFALDAQTGHRRWQVTASPHVRALRVLDDLLFVDTGGGFTGPERLVVWALDGQQRWQYVPPRLQDIPAWVVDGGVFYTMTSGEGASVVAREAATGTRRWQTPLRVTSPLLSLLAAGPDALLVVTQERLMLVQRKDGAEVWRRDQTLAVAPQVIDGTVYGFFVDQPATIGGEPPVFLRALALTNGRLQWQQPLPGSDAGFLSSGQPLMVGAITNAWAALVDAPDFTTLHVWMVAAGRLRWTYQAGERIEGLLADAAQVSLASAQQLVALQTDTGQERWRQANPDQLTTLRAAAGILIGLNPLTSTLAGYDPTRGQRLWRLHLHALMQYLVC